MPVSITRSGTTATITWDAEADPHDHLAALLDGGGLEAVLTVLALGEYDEAAAVEEFERVRLLRAASPVSAELTRRVRDLTVAARDSGVSWGTLASALTGDPAQRSTARSTYAAGLRQGAGGAGFTTYACVAHVGDDEGDMTFHADVTAVSPEAARTALTRRLAERGLTARHITLTARGSIQQTETSEDLS